MPTLIDDRLLDAIAQWESNNDPEAVGDAGASRGAYQMQRIAFEDVQRVFPDLWNQRTYEEVIADPQLQRAASRAYLEAGEQAYGITDLKRLISFYNRGPKARYGTITNTDYVEGVLGLYQPQESRMTDPIDERIMGINRSMMAAGFGRPLEAPEIEQMLVRMVGMPDSIVGEPKPYSPSEADSRTALFRSRVPIDRAIGGMKTPLQRGEETGFTALQPFLNDSQALISASRRRTSEPL